MNYTVVVSVKNDRKQLLPGMTARVNFVTRSAEDVLKVANAALRFKPADAKAEAAPARSRRASSLYVVDAKGDLQPLNVQTGVTDGSFTEVRGDAVREGMKVIAGTAQPQTAQSQSTSTNPFQGNQQQQGGRRPGGF